MIYLGFLLQVSVTELIRGLFPDEEVDAMLTLTNYPVVTVKQHIYMYEEYKWQLISTKARKDSITKKNNSTLFHSSLPNPIHILIRTHVVDNTERRRRFLIPK